MQQCSMDNDEVQRSGTLHGADGQVLNSHLVCHPVGNVAARARPRVCSKNDAPFESDCNDRCAHRYRDIHGTRRFHSPVRRGHVRYRTHEADLGLDRNMCQARSHTVGCSATTVTSCRSLSRLAPLDSRSLGMSPLMCVRNLRVARFVAHRGPSLK